MKKVLTFLLLVNSLIFSQTETNKSLYELKNQLNLQETTQMEYTFTDNLSSKKSVGLAMVYSLLLPGMGELYAGDYSLGKYFTIADGALWGFLIGINAYGNWQENNYKSFASSVGGVHLNGKDDNYFANIGNYIDIDQYNRRKMLDRSFGEIYNLSTDYWKWDNQSQRREYRNMWKSSENAFNNIRFAAGALILNRIASIINAVRLVVKHNKRLEQEFSWQISFDVVQSINLPSSLNMHFVTSF